MSARELARKLHPHEARALALAALLAIEAVDEAEEEAEGKLTEACLRGILADLGRACMPVIEAAEVRS